MEKIKVSIITVCLNSEKTIERTIKSVMNQTYSNIEYIIVDGMSTDGTMDIINKYSSKIKLIRERDNGLYDAMNKGIKNATGEMICLLNSDDWYEPNTIEEVMRVYKENTACVIYGMLRRYYNGKVHSVQFMHDAFLETEGMCHSSCFISRKAYEIGGLYNLEYRICSDLDFLLRLKESLKVEFIPIYKILTNFSMGGVSANPAIVNDINLIKYRHGIISKKSYYINSFKERIHLLIQKLHLN
ncbi:MAG: glycosyltransferase family 2 protein [Candidatus Choladocola sp.]|nr:glycosyltransferase family 2 protein [Candidatus Choladocola sp.]